MTRNAIDVAWSCHGCSEPEMEMETAATQMMHGDEDHVPGQIPDESFWVTEDISPVTEILEE